MKTYWFSVLLAFAAAACADDSTSSASADVGRLADVSSMSDVRVDAAPQPAYCGNGVSSGAYVDARLQFVCADLAGELRSEISLYECTGCSTPFQCDSDCENPKTYLKIQLGPYDEDLTGRTFTEADTVAARCRVDTGACEAPSSFSVSVEDSAPGCARGTYTISYDTGETQTGAFDAAGIPPSVEAVETCEATR